MPALAATGGGPLSIVQTSTAAEARWARLGELYAENGALVFRFLRRRGVPPREVDDALQETFLIAWKKLDSLRPDASARGWLLSIANRVASHTHRKERKMAAHGDDPDPLEAGGVSPEEAAARSEAVEVVARFVEGLDEVRRDVFLLSEVDGLTAPEIVEVTGANLNTVYTRIRAVRRAFREHVESAGGGS